MVFKCQEDSFLKEFSSKVIQCEETKQPVVEYGKSTEFEGYEVVLDNTIMFPAGGGQPHDIGWLDDKEVVQVLRRGPQALHFTKEPIKVGTTVVQKIDWPRRFDHMQQHSGQHLISSIFEKDYDLQTTSWWLGSDECFVELNTKAISEDVLEAVENKCNDLIRLAIPVNVKFCKPNDPGLNEAHTRGLPKDCIDTIRVICIGEIDENMCCGTHVSNLSQLQVIKLLGVEAKKKGRLNVRFLVGGRVTKTMHMMLDREHALTALLNNAPSKHEELVLKLQKNLKLTTKNLQNVLADLAQHEIEKIRSTSPKPKYIFLFKKEATPEFCRLLCKGLENDGIALVLIAEDSDKPREGQLFILGTENDCSVLGKRMSSTLKGKGFYKNGLYQGKMTDLTKANVCEILTANYFRTNGDT